MSPRIHAFGAAALATAALAAASQACWGQSAAPAPSAAPNAALPSYDVMYARMTGASNSSSASSSGKCTLEFEVDGSAEIEVLAEQARMRTTGGNPATWRRFECNQPLPPDAKNFRLSPQTGRGTQTLLKAPADNRGIAAVRIEDPANGREGYKFDLEWNGGTALPALSSTQPASAPPSGAVITGPVTSGGNAATGATANPNNSSIFDSPASPAPPNAAPSTTSTAPPATTGTTAESASVEPLDWNRTIQQREKGDGYYRSFFAPDDTVNEAEIRIDAIGSVTLDLYTTAGKRISFDGRLLMAEPNRLIANMLGDGMQGALDILLDNGHVGELAMTGSGRNRFELRWRSR